MKAKFYWAVVGDGNPEPVAVTGKKGAREMLARETARRIQSRVAAGDVDLRDVAQLCGEAWDQDMLAYVLEVAARPTAGIDREERAIVRDFLISLTGGGKNAVNTLSINHDELAALVKRAVGENKPCRGIVRVELREEPAPAVLPIDGKSDAPA